ncbi:hypothetical protein MMC28_008090 [Mycoblastus sanguinarius]|nr:hypothetical protein [Mycoblastus sanguinarius]
MLTDKQLASSTFHLICTPSRCIELVNGVLKERERVLSLGNEGTNRPVFAWEPMEHSCRPNKKDAFYEALRFVDVFSPNEHELAALFGDTPDTPEGSYSLELVHRRCIELFDNGFSGLPKAVVIRLGAKGCFVYQDGRCVSIPACHKPVEDLNGVERATWKDKVVDVTGGGNAFLGGFCMGLMSEEFPDHEKAITVFERAAIYGSVAASFAIEQIGMPKKSNDEGNGKELWNNEDPTERLITFFKGILDDWHNASEEQMQRLHQQNLFQNSTN